MQNKRPKNKSFLYGAMVLGAGGILAKFLGVLYRIPLSNIIGAEGIGLYQMVFPFYTLLLTISSAGLPAAISKMVAEALAQNDRKGAEKVFKAAVVSLSVLGVIATLLVFALHKVVAKLQGNSAAALSYVGIAPALFFVALVSAFRGFFQGRQNMLPTALSQLTEQIVKIAFGIVFAKMLLPYGTAYAALGALLGVSVSEAFAAAQLWIQYLVYKKKERKHRYIPEADCHGDGVHADGERQACAAPSPCDTVTIPTAPRPSVVRRLFAISIPITLGAIILPVTQLIDSALVINILKGGGFSERISTILYGLMTGHVMSLINMPVVLSVAVAAAVMPGIAASNIKGNKPAVEKKTGSALRTAVILAVPCVVIMCVFSRQIIGLLYGRSLRNDPVLEAETAARLLSATSLSIVYIAVVQVITAALQAVGKTYVPVINLGIGSAIKIVLNLVLISSPRLHIYGAAISTCACYAVAALLDMAALRKYVGRCEVGLREIWAQIFKRKKRENVL